MAGQAMLVVLFLKKEGFFHAVYINVNQLPAILDYYELRCSCVCV